MDERWERIRDFQPYLISDHGKVQNEDTGRLLALSRNQSGNVFVGLMKGRTQHKRSVALLVGSYFLEPAGNKNFDTAMHLDGDTLNNHYENLIWRPRWFAIKYRRQFYDNPSPAIVRELIDLRTHRIYRNSHDAAMQHGLLDQEILAAIINRTYVWPTYQRFAILEE